MTDMKRFTFFLIALCGIQIFPQITITKDFTFGNNSIFEASFDPNQTILSSNTIILPDHSILQIVSVVNNDYLFKLLPNGTLDTSFGDNGRLALGVNNFVNAVVQGDKIIVYFGPKSLDHSNYLDSKIVRLHSNGTLDITFGNNGVLNEITESTHPQALSVLVLQDLSLVVTNSAETHPKKFTMNGELDTSFGNNGEINYSYHFPIGQFSNGKIATCNVNSLSSSLFSFFDLNSLSLNTVLDLNNYSCHQNNGFPIQNKTNNSTRITSDGMVYSVFEYQNYPLPDFSRLIVMKDGQLDSSFNGAGFVTSQDDEQFLDAGSANNLFLTLNQKENQQTLSAYSASGLSLKINNQNEFALSSGNEIEMKDNYILVNSIVPDANQNLVKMKIEKFIMVDERLSTINNSLKNIKVENPIKDFLIVSNAENADRFEIYDMQGRMLLASKTPENMNTANLTKGLYLLKIYFKNGEHFSQKIIKN